MCRWLSWRSLYGHCAQSRSFSSQCQLAVTPSASGQLKSLALKARVTINCISGMKSHPTRLFLEGAGSWAVCVTLRKAPGSCGWEQRRDCTDDTGPVLQEPGPRVPHTAGGATHCERCNLSAGASCRRFIKHGTSEQPSAGAVLWVSCAGGAGGRSKCNTPGQGNKLLSLPVVPHWGPEGLLGSALWCVQCGGLLGAGAAEHVRHPQGSSPSPAMLSKDGVSVHSVSKRVL